MDVETSLHVHSNLADHDLSAVVVDTFGRLGEE
jgi:hypothetical protein